MNKLLFFTMCMLVSLSVRAETNICIGTLSFPSGDASLGANFSSSTRFLIRAGESSIEVGEGESKSLAFKSASVISISKNGEPYSAIPFSSTKYSGSKYCLWLYWPHATWQLNEYQKGRWGCNCF